MKKYLELVEDSFNESHFNERHNSLPYVAYSTANDKVMYNFKDYFYIESLEDNNIIYFQNFHLGAYSNKVEYCIKLDDWKSLEGTSQYTLNKNEKIYLRCCGDTIKKDSYDDSIPLFDSVEKVNVGGNMDMLIFNYLDVDVNAYDFTRYSMASMFTGTKIVDASKLLLTTTELSTGAYDSMFSACTYLKKGPKLPATTLGIECYYAMFDGCTSLEGAPKLPATQLKNGCYQFMFRGCTSLKSAPELRATQLVTSCYQGMFQDCNSLVRTYPIIAEAMQIRSLNATFMNCSNLETINCTILVDEIPESGISAMFRGCSSLKTVPVIKSTKLGKDACNATFAYCHELPIVPELNIETVSEKSCLGMFLDCYSITESPVLKASQLQTSCYNQMFNGCKNLTKITCLATENISNGTTNWVSGVPSNGTFIKHPNSTWSTGVNGIPAGWAVEEYK